MPTRAADENRLLEKLRRLPPDKAKEVEDFIDTLNQLPQPDATALDAAYREMASDQAREEEALAWSEAHIHDGLDALPEEKRGDWH